MLEVRKLPSYLGLMACGLFLWAPAVLGQKSSAGHEQLLAALRALDKGRAQRAYRLANEALEAVETDSERQAALNLMGLALRDQAKGDPKVLRRAKVALWRALAASPTDNPFVVYNFAIVLSELGEHEKALEVVRELYAVGEETPLTDAARRLVCKTRRQLEKEVPFLTARKPPHTESSEERLDKAHSLEDIIDPPERIFEPRPTNTSGKYGLMIVQAVIDKEGCVVAAKSLMSQVPGSVTEAALETVRTWVFRPARRAGEPVAVYYNLTIIFI